MKKCGLKACVVSVSGGVDSAVTLGLMKYASEMKDSPIQKVRWDIWYFWLHMSIRAHLYAVNHVYVQVCMLIDIHPYMCNIPHRYSESLSPFTPVRGLWIEQRRYAMIWNAIWSLSIRQTCTSSLLPLLTRLSASRASLLPQGSWGTRACTHLFVGVSTSGCMYLGIDVRNLVV